MIGVIPDPPAIPTYRFADAASNGTVNDPTGLITSIASPACRLSATQFENSPPAIRLTVTLTSPSSGATHNE